MAGQLTIDTLKASSGVLATQNGMTGIAKAWVQWNGSTAAINGSFNVSSVTKNGTGYYDVNFTTPMPNINYSAVGSASINTGANGFATVCPNSIPVSPYYTGPSVNYCRMITTYNGGAGGVVDPVYANFAVFA